jgi:hypothetical protein
MTRSTKIHIFRRGASMLSCSAALPLSHRTLTFTAGVIRGHRKQIGSCWRKLSPGQQALRVLAFLRKGETFAELAAGFSIGTSTAWRYVTETVGLLAARSPKLRRALADAQQAGHALRRDRRRADTDRPGGRDRRFYSGKHRRHGMNLQVIASLHGHIVWVSGPLPGAVHDLTAARIWGIALTPSSKPGASCASSAAARGGLGNWPRPSISSRPARCKDEDSRPIPGQPPEENAIAGAHTLSILFSLRGLSGLISVSLTGNTDPDAIGYLLLSGGQPNDAARGFPVCRATVTYPADGYAAMFGWTQMVRSTDSDPARFEMDPIAFYQQIPTPYAFFGVRPELFDAPSRDSRDDMTWEAHSFLCVTRRRAHPPRPGDRRLPLGLHHRPAGHRLHPASRT